MIKRFERLRRSEGGFTLIELLVVVAIIALLATLALPRVFEAINTSKRDATKGELATISGALARFYLEKGQYPEKLTELGTAGYLKSGTTYKNKFGNFYLYAVNDAVNTTTNAKPTAFVLVDPGNSPTAAATPTLCSDAGYVGKAPAGENPTIGKTMFWRGAPTAAADGRQLTLMDGAACNTAPASTPSSLDTWTAARTDLFTE